MVGSLPCSSGFVGRRNKRSTCMMDIENLPSLLNILAIEDVPHASGFPCWNYGVSQALLLRLARERFGPGAE